MKVLLTHGYFLAEDPREQRIMRPYPPLGLLYLAAWLRDRRVAVEVFDSTFSTRGALERRLLAERPAVLGLYANLLTRPSLVSLLRWVRAQPSLRATRVVLGGPEVTHHVEPFLAHGADALVLGEGEQTLFELVTEWSKPEPRLEGVPGLAFRDAAGAVVRTPPRKLLPSLDALPEPARDAIDLAPYLRAWRERHGSSAVSVSTMRGCPYTCRWCSRAVYGESYRRRAPRLVAEEIAHIVERYAPDTLWFVDDVFTIHHGWLEALTLELERRGVRVPYECITRADRLDERSVGLLRRSGCFRVWIGAESGSQRVLDAMDRRVKVGRVREMIQRCKRAGIETGTFLMLGYPGETEADLEETIAHLESADPDLFTITLAYPIKGTPFYDEVADTLAAPPAWERSTDRDLRFARPHSELYYRFAVDRVVHEVARRKASRREGLRAALSATQHGARALLARAGMKADPLWRALEARGLRGGAQ